VDGLGVVEAAPAVRRLVGVAGADERSLHWRLSAWENLRLFGALQGLRGAVLKERAAEVLALVGLERGAPALVGQFSSGMRQRLLIARALLPRPRLLLLDEPTRSLDPMAARDLRQFVRRTLVEREGCTVLLATHAADEAVGLCDRVGVLHRGRLLAVGPAAQLAAGLREERWAFTTPQGCHPLWETLAGAPPRVAAGEAGWSRVELALAGGLPAVAEVVRRLGEAGVSVAGVERVSLPLAELLERLTAVGEDDA
jgi:ABC-2 type transport system ATP-binding protein